jgi:hypothetical protein
MWIGRIIPVNLLLLAVLCVPSIGFGHLDQGDRIVVTEVVLDRVSLISTDETVKTDDVRIYTKIQTQGHQNQEALIALTDDQYGGILKSAWEESGKTEYGSRPVIGHILYYHVNCNPHEPFNIELGLWDDDSFDLDDILDAAKDLLDLPGVPEELKLWGGVGIRLGKLVQKLSEGSRDNWSELQIGPRHYTGQQTLRTVLRCCNDQDWEEGDPGADFHLSFKKRTLDRACDLEGWRTTMEEFMEQLELEEVLRARLKESYSRLLQEVEEKNDTQDDIEQGRISEAEGSRRISEAIVAIDAGRADVDLVVTDVAETWTGDDGRISMDRYQDIERLEYWADATVNLGDWQPQEIEYPAERVVATGTQVSVSGRVVADRWSYGTVVGPTGATVSGVVVRVDDDETTTDAEGRFWIEPGLDTGNHTVVLLNPIEEGSSPGSEIEVFTGNVPTGAAVPDIERAPRYIGWENVTVAGSSFTCAPGQYVEARFGNDLGTVLACDGGTSWIVQPPTTTVDGGPPALGPVDLVVAVDGRESQPVMATRLALESYLSNPSLAPGQKGWLHISIKGTLDRVPLRIENLAPANVELKGGVMQSRRTSGGEQNTLKIRYTGKSPGEFLLNVAIEDNLASVH